MSYNAGSVAPRFVFFFFFFFCEAQASLLAPFRHFDSKILPFYERGTFYRSVEAKKNSNRG